MRIGVICEGGPVTPKQPRTDNPDARVIEHFVRLLGTSHELVFNPLGKKPDLKGQCGIAARLLLNSETAPCDLVVIVWDLHPSEWGGVPRKERTEPCRKADRDAMLVELSVAGVRLDQVVLLCVEREIETVLLTDERALSTVLTRSRIANVARVKRPEAIANPKERLMRIYREHGATYNPAIDNPRIARAMTDSSRIVGHDAIERLREKLSRFA